MECNKLFLVCHEAIDTFEGCCSEACMQSPARRPLDEKERFIPFRRWYKYFNETPVHDHGQSGSDH